MIKNGLFIEDRMLKLRKTSITHKDFRKSLYIHATLMTRHSKPLDRMITGHMCEAETGVASLENVNVKTFVRFIRWA